MQFRCIMYSPTAQFRVATRMVMITMLSKPVLARSVRMNLRPHVAPTNVRESHRLTKCFWSAVIHDALIQTVHSRVTRTPCGHHALVGVGVEEVLVFRTFALPRLAVEKHVRVAFTAQQNMLLSNNYKSCEFMRILRTCCWCKSRRVPWACDIAHFPSHSSFCDSCKCAWNWNRHSRKRRLPHISRTRSRTSSGSSSSRACGNDACPHRRTDKTGIPIINSYYHFFNSAWFLTFCEQLVPLRPTQRSETGS